MQYFDPDGHAPWDVVTKAAGAVWDNTGGKAVTAVNRHVVQPVLRSAAVQAVKSTTATLTRTVGGAAKRGARFVRRNAKTIARVGAVAIAGGGTFVGCTVATVGLGAVGCGIAAGAVGSTVNAAFDCPGRSAGQCAKGLGIGFASGGVAGGVGGFIGAGAGGLAVARMAAAGYAGTFTHSATSQGLSTGRVDLRAAHKDGVFGAVTGAGLFVGGKALSSLRSARAPAPAEPVTPQTAGDLVEITVSRSRYPRTSRTRRLLVVRLS